MKCQNCGAELSKDSITVKEGAIFIACPYCGAAYQMVEEPKW
jgi:DNA-directed RNA polymerase subunit RPC12/RpoP